MAHYIYDKKLKSLGLKANEIRQDIIKTLSHAGSGHTAGSLGMADIFTVLYFHLLNHDPKRPDWDGRDRLILSNGHICPVQYVALAHAGYFPIDELKTLRQLNTRLQGHPHRGVLPGIETTSGPLGSGLSQASGMALAALMDNKKHYVYCLMSDGELQEGNTWEALMFAPKYKLRNLIAVIDRNNIQIDGFTENVMPLEPLREKFESFNWHVVDVDGHNMEAFVYAVNEAKAIYESPTVIIAHTIPGKGVEEIENDFRWHGVPPGKGPGDLIEKERQEKEFLKRLRTLNKKIEAGHMD